MKDISDATKELLKNFVLNVNDVKPNELSERLQLILPVLKHNSGDKEVFCAVTKVISRSLLSAYLLRYQSHASQKHVRVFYLRLLACNAVDTCNVLADSVNFVLNRTTAPASDSPGVCRIGLLALKLLVGCVVHRKLNTDQLDIPCLVNALIASSSLVLAGKKQKKVSKLINVLFKKHPTLVSSILEYCLNDNCTEKHLLLVGLTFAHCKQSNKTQLIQPILSKSVENFVKFVLAAKTCPPNYIVNACGPIVGRIGHDMFKESVLPNIKKYSLRNAENVVPAVLHGKNEEMSGFAVDAIKMLAKQCSNSESVLLLVKYVFDVLNGCEGKLSSAQQRTQVLQGLSALSEHTVSGPQPNYIVSEAALIGLIKVLKDELHEASVITICQQLTSWIQKCSNKLPPQVTSWFIEGLNPKRLSSNVRFEYLRCISTAYHANILECARDLIPTLLWNVENANKNGNQSSVVLEGMASGLILLKLVRIDPQLDEKMIKNNFWTALLDRKLFTNNKILMEMNENALCLLCELVQRVLCEFSDHLSDGSFPGDMCRCLILGMVWPTSRPRATARAGCKRLLSLLGGHEFAKAMFHELACALEDNWLLQAYSSASKEKLSDGDSVECELAPKRLLELCLCLCETEGWEGYQINLVLCEALKCCAVSQIVSADPWIWVQLMVKLKLTPFEFCHENGIQLCETIEQIQDTQTRANAAGLLAKVDAELVWEKLLTPRLKELNIHKINEVTQTQVEIMRTPEDTLYDTSILENCGDSNNKLSNMKRESKLYSYKDQLADAQIRKEIEEKKKREGKMDSPKLSQKQREAMKSALAEEKNIREATRALRNETIGLIEMVIGVTEANSQSAGDNIMIVLDKLTPLVCSPLVVDHMQKWWNTLAIAILPSFYKNTVDLFVNCSLRLMKCPEVPEEWCKESLKCQSLRVLQLLNEKITATSNEENAYFEDILTSPLFALCYPLMKSLLIDADNIFDDEALTKMRIGVIKFIEANLTRDDLVGSDVTKLPIPGVFDALLKLVQTCPSGQVQQRAAAVSIRIAQTVNLIKDKPIQGVEQIAKRLLDALVFNETSVREVALKALVSLSDTLSGPDFKRSNGIDYLLQRCWVARFDDFEDCATLANILWQNLDCKLTEKNVLSLLEDVTSDVSCVRESAAPAMKAALQDKQTLIAKVLQLLEKSYTKMDKYPEPVVDSVGRVISGPVDLTWTARCGIALCLRHICPLIPDNLVDQFFSLLVPVGVSDPHEQVQNFMLQAAIATVKEHGEMISLQKHVSTLLPLLEAELSAAPDNVDFDTIRQSLVVVLGSLAKHMNPQDPKIKPIVARLIETLSTPSQQVQEAVAECLPPLVPAIRDQAPELAAQLLHLLLEAQNYGERRGAAYGVAGLVKGLGIVALRQLDIMPTVQQALDNKKKPQHREGALLALEMLCRMLGKLFEPYVVSVLPSLLLALGDNDMHVRAAAEDCSKVIMSNLSAHGVRLVLPALLAALKEDSWRTKAGSVELLGAMAYCAPKQLSSCLPSIVPKLIEVLGDTHHKVQKAGEQALKQIGLVIRNPEVQALSDLLLAAIEDPSTKTSVCLSTLLRTQFVHYIDAPSLALIMPVVQRAFDDRSTDTRKLAAQIIGNIYALTDQKDVEPYLDQLLPGLQKCLLDPNPEVRGRAASALGAMLRAASGDMATKLQQELIPWLKERLVANTSSVDRSGAAQGLSEVLGGLGEEHLERVLPDIISTAESDTVEAHVRDGYILMFIYLPAVFGDALLPKLTRIIPAILKSLAVEEEFVRDSALKAGQRLIAHYCDSAIELLLPSLQSGLFDENWRIRFASVTLMGEFLFRITGVTGKMTTEGGDDDAFGSESSNKVISRILGQECRLNVLSGLYMARADVALQVRLSAGHVWKVIVSNTGRTLKEILPTLFHLLLGSLATSSSERQTIAARCLGELVKKMGERVLVDVVPVLEQGLQSPEPNQREGVCIALSEIIDNTTRDMVMMYSENLVPTVKTALCDKLEQVRLAAAESFNRLHSAIGPQALDDVLLPMLQLLDDKKIGAFALDGLQKVMALKSKVVLPYLIPKLITPPINTMALSQLTSVAGDALIKHLHKVCDALLLSVTTSQTDQDKEIAHDLCLDVILSVKEEDGVSIIIEFLTQKSLGTDKIDQLAAIHLLDSFCQKTTASLKPKVDHLISTIVTLYGSEDEDILKYAIGALTSVVKTLDQREQLDHVPSMRAAVRSTISKLCVGNGQLLPGFCNSKGLGPVLPVLREGVLNGSADLKEISAICLGEVICASTDVALKAHVVNVTGPLIRVLGDRYQPSVKIAILHTLAVFLQKVGVMLKPFLPQLQSTFLKAVQETSSRGVRLHAARALARLCLIHPKPDVVAVELIKSIKTNNEDNAILETNILALRGVIVGVGDKVNDEVVCQLISTLKQFINHDDDATRVAAACATGAIATKATSAANLINDTLLDSSDDAWKSVHGRVVGLQMALTLDAQKTMDIGGDKLIKCLQNAITSDRVAVASGGLRAAGLLLVEQRMSNTMDNVLLTTVCRAVNSQLVEAKILSGVVVAHIAKDKINPIENSHLRIIVPAMINGMKEKNSAVRCACEEALVNVLNMRLNSQMFKTYVEQSDPGAQLALSGAEDVLNKVAKKPEPTLEPLDDTEAV